MEFTVGKYIDYGTGRQRWAVFHGPTRVFYFAKHYGKKPAERLCKRLNAIDP